MNTRRKLRIVHLLGIAVLLSTGILSRARAAETVEKEEKAKATPDTHNKIKATYLGVGVRPVTASLTAQLNIEPHVGLVVQYVNPDSPAGKMGLSKHDLLTRFDNQVLINPQQLAVLVRRCRDGQEVKLTFIRAGKKMTETVKLSTTLQPPLSFTKFGNMGSLQGLPALRLTGATARDLAEAMEALTINRAKADTKLLDAARKMAPGPNLHDVIIKHLHDAPGNDNHAAKMEALLENLEDGVNVRTITVTKDGAAQPNVTIIQNGKVLKGEVDKLPQEIRDALGVVTEHTENKNREQEKNKEEEEVF